MADFTFRILIFFVMLNLLISPNFGKINKSPYISLPEMGTVAGEVGETNNGREFWKFWCIPYAKHRRFEMAEPPDTWNGTLDTRECQVRCPVFAGAGFTSMVPAIATQEHCLILNVFMPPGMPSQPLPVMFFIHGGYFQGGSSQEYSGEMLLDADIVLVTINYRLGPLGFLDSGDGEMPANLGMKDCIYALRWVQKYIRFFGGDPNKVTIFGESAGGGAVSHLMISPMAKGLFHSAISQSGSNSAPWAYQSRPRENFFLFAEKMNCSAPTTKKVLECMMPKEIEDFASAQDMKWLLELQYTFYPSIEVRGPKNKEIFLPDHPRKMMAEGNLNKVPLVIGCCEDEGAYQAALTITDSSLLNGLNTNWEVEAPLAFGLDHRNISAQALKDGIWRLRRHYFGDGDIHPKANLYNLTDLFSDSWFLYSQDANLRYISKYTPVYPYVFTKKGGLKIANILGVFDRDIASHGDELQYLFFKGLAGSEADERFLHKFILLWVSIAYNHKPSYLWGDTIKSWPTIDPSKPDREWKFLRIDDQLEVINNPYAERLRIWNELWEGEWKEY